MKSIKTLISLFILILFIPNLFAQTYGPEKMKAVDSKLLKNRTLLVPFVEKIPLKCKDMSGWRAFNTDTKTENEWKRRVDEALSNSSFDFFKYEVKDFNKDKIKKNKDKNYAVLYFDKDFYQNIYVHIALAEPKWHVIATAPVNDLMLSDIPDLTLMFNMLQFSLVQTSGAYQESFKPLYRGHEFKYKTAIDEFTTDIRAKSFLVTKYDKKEKGYAKKNEKMNEYLKLDWKLTGFNFIYENEIKDRVNAGFDGLYMKPFTIYTANPKADYYYIVFLTSPGNQVVYWFLALDDIKPANLRYLQPKIDDWFLSFMDQKKRRSYEELKAKEKAIASPPLPSKSKSSPKKKSSNSKAKDSDSKSKSSDSKSKSDLKPKKAKKN